MRNLARDALLALKLCRMATRSALVEKLVLTLHLNVAERKMLGSEPVRASEVANVITRVLKNCGKFPPMRLLGSRVEMYLKDTFLKFSGMQE